MAQVAREVVVRGGQGVIENLKNYPEGTRLKIVIVDDGEELDAADLRDLDVALEKAVESEKAGRVVSASDLIRKMRATR